MKGMGFFTFEEDLPHHIREAFVIISTGSAISFFDNPYVRDWLRSLNPAHRPLYRQKFLRIIRVIQFILVRRLTIFIYSCLIIIDTSHFDCLFISALSYRIKKLALC